MSDPIDDVKAALVDLSSRVKAIEEKAATAAHAETQSLVKAAHDKIDAAAKAASDEFALIKAALVTLEEHVTTTVENALHSPAGLALGAFVCVLLGAGGLALAQHLGIVG